MATISPELKAIFGEALELASEEARCAYLCRQRHLIQHTGHRLCERRICFSPGMA